MASCSCLVLRRDERCAGIFGKALGTPHSHTESYILSKGGSWSVPEAKGLAVATKHQPWILLLFKKVLSVEGRK